jgi:type VI secretion system secreted protein VgrG
MVEGKPVPEIAAGMAQVKASGHEAHWFTDDPHDPGGATAWGITLETAQRHGIQTKDELRAITPEKVAEIYCRDYWKFSQVDDDRVAIKLVDMAVNVGPVTAVRMAQLALNDLGADLVPDGVMGPHTVACLNAVGPNTMLRMLCADLGEYYRARVVKNPDLKRYLTGWLARAEEVPGE